MDRRKKHKSDGTPENTDCISDCILKCIHVHNAQKDLKLSKKAVRSLVETVLEYLGSQHTEVSIYFVTQAKICALHDQFFQDPAPTDCISFPLDDEHLGEIFVCPKAALDYDGSDPYQEVALYVIHGILHCLGYDDLEPIAKRAMRKKEKSCMALINKLGINLAP